MKQLLVNLGIGLFIILSLNSCDPFNHIDGLVVDEKTNEPIDSVHVYVNFNGEILDSFTSIRDSLTKAERQDYINKYGNHEKWIDGGGNKMFRDIPTLTENGGKFDIGFPVGFFPHYKLYLEKTGYETFEIKNKQINWNERPKVFKMKKKSGA
jgi:hypothetical protein